MQYIPIIVPQKCYIDKANNQNCYFTNVISLYINDDDITILIRFVNYRKFSNKNFFVGGQNQSESLYGLLTGKKFDNLVYQDLSYDWNNFKRYPTYWVGMEDIRFINNQFLLVTVPECNKTGQPCLFLAELKSNVIKLISHLEPNHIEKNWMPFIHDKNIKVIYKVDPLTIKSLVQDDCQIISQHGELKGYHGSTNGIPYKDGFLFMIHLYTDRTVHRWLYYNPDTNKIKTSTPFSFFNYSFIEFTASLAQQDEFIFTSLSVNEEAIFIVKIHIDSIPL